MKAISVKQPWASMIASRKKTIETRTWRTSYHGPLIIVSSKRPKLGLLNGHALAVVELIDCRPMLKEDWRQAKVGFHPQLWSWVLGNIRTINPFPVTGRRRLYEIPNVNFCKVCGCDIAEWNDYCGECTCEDDCG